jgi:hypothetical protein
MNAASVDVVLGIDAGTGGLRAGAAGSSRKLHSAGTQNNLAVMNAKRLRRFIGISAAGFHIDENDPPLLRYLLKPTCATGCRFRAPTSPT